MVAAAGLALWWPHRGGHGDAEELNSFSPSAPTAAAPVRRVRPEWTNDEARQEIVSEYDRLAEHIGADDRNRAQTVRRTLAIWSDQHNVDPTAAEVLGDLFDASRFGPDDLGRTEVVAARQAADQFWEALP